MDVNKWDDGGSVCTGCKFYGMMQVVCILDANRWNDGDRVYTGCK